MLRAAYGLLRASGMVFLEASPADLDRGARDEPEKAVTAFQEF